jgi:hypothetical protein
MSTTGEREIERFPQKQFLPEVTYRDVAQTSTQRNTLVERESVSLREIDIKEGKVGE